MIILTTAVALTGLLLFPAALTLAGYRLARRSVRDFREYRRIVARKR